MNNKNAWKLAELPPKKDLESKKILKRLPKAHAALARIKRDSIKHSQSAYIDQHLRAARS